MQRLKGRGKGIPQYVKLMKEYANHQRYFKGNMENTIRLNAMCLIRFGRHLLENYGSIPATITRDHVISYVLSLTCGRRAKIFYIGYLKNFFRYLEQVGKISTNPAATIKLKHHPAKMGDCLTLNEINKFIDSLPTNTVFELRDKAIIYTLYSTGIRVAELCNLELKDYIPDQGVVKVKGKGRVERYTPIGSNAIRAVEAYLVRRKEIARYRLRYQALFVNRIGCKLTTRSVRRIVENRAKAAGIKHSSPHVLRRSCATHMLNAGAPIRYVQEQLGHRSISSTQRYTVLTTEDLIEAYRKTGFRSGDTDEKNIHDGDW